jgi:hypothetical protein
MCIGKKKGYKIMASRFIDWVVVEMDKRGLLDERG